MRLQELHHRGVSAELSAAALHSVFGEGLDLRQHLEQLEDEEEGQRHRFAGGAGAWRALRPPPSSRSERVTCLELCPRPPPHPHPTPRVLLTVRCCPALTRSPDVVTFTSRSRPRAAAAGRCAQQVGLHGKPG